MQDVAGIHLHITHIQGMQRNMLSRRFNVEDLD